MKKYIENFVLKIAIKYNKLIEAFKLCIYYIEKDINKTECNIQKRGVKREIMEVIKNYVITYTDKAIHNFAIICKKY